MGVNFAARRATNGQGAIIPGPMAGIDFTRKQRQAIGTVGRSVIVSAAAGSGKTAVLAERCAYLVCDAPDPHRCNVDELLVLTFTDAAAAEMRSRIVEAIRARLRDRPGDERLQEQAALVGAARISTIHAFCLWLIRRWFSELGVDPGAVLLDADEASLLKREVLDALFTRLYDDAADDESTGPLGDASEGGAGEPPGTVPTEPRQAADSDTASAPRTLGHAFAELVDRYGLGEDRGIVALVLRLFEFVSSLPDPDRWLDEACEAPAGRAKHTVLELMTGLRTELRWQIDHCDHAAAAVEAGDPIGHFHASRVREYVDCLQEWISDLPSSRDAGPGQVGIDGTLAAFDTVRERIAAFEFDRRTGPRLGKDADPALLAARDAARAHFDDVKKRLFQGRLRKRFGLFSVAEWLDGLEATGPYVATLVELVRAFGVAYAARKRRSDVLDFSDLERLAHALLSSKDDSRRPSEVARTLHRRFAHVLVDEFQDINPIQQAIIRLASRESDPDQSDNLFVVGDVKQSIYRFRLAEPAIFTDRLRAFRSTDGDAAAIALQRNFRSRGEIIDGVNLLFRQLMPVGAGDVVYDEEAELHPGRKIDPDAARLPVDVHLLERSWQRLEENHDDAPIEQGVTDLDDPSRWAPIEREAHLIGLCIREWMSGGKSAPVIDGRPLAYRDVVLLLRAARVNAERMAVMLTAMGIPAHADTGGSLFGATEVRDVMAALRVLDNPRQDIPLSAALRNGMFSEPLSEDDLVCIKCHSRDIPFHDAVRAYAEHGEGGAVRERLAVILARIDRYRDRVRRRPLAEVLWSLYEQQGYLAYVGGLPNGAQRRANLLKLHELARKFGTFRRQGLHRFLRFVETLEEGRREIATAPAIGESDDVVRIMSIHQAKGLEFPVVFVAGLGTQFNLGDRSGRAIFERHAGIGLRAIDSDRMIEYPSASHRLAADEIERSAREEELRILYVAMTRAREKLVLIGSGRGVDRHRLDARDGCAAPGPSLLSLTSAIAPLDWLIPALSSLPDGVVHRSGERADGTTVFNASVWGQEDMASWSVAGAGQPSHKAALRAVAGGEALPPDEPLAPDDPEVEDVLARFEHVYPRLAVSSIRAVLGASEVKRAYDFGRDPDERSELPAESPLRPAPIRTPGHKDAEQAAHRGVITHRVLQHLDFAVAADTAGVASELQRMTGEGVIALDDRAVVDTASIQWFVSTPLAAAIRRAGNAYRREFSFIATEPPSYFDESVGPTPGDHVLVRGIVDGVLPIEEGVAIVDFKTDRVTADGVDQRAERYRPQMAVYARAMSRLWRRPVCACWLVFLSARQMVRLCDVV